MIIMSKLKELCAKWVFGKKNKSKITESMYQWGVEVERTLI